MKNYSFDNIIKEKAAGHEAPVPADAWNNIRKQKKRRPVIAWRVLALLLIGLGLFGVYQVQYRQSGKPVASQAGKETNTVATNDDALHAGRDNEVRGTGQQEPGVSNTATQEEATAPGENSTVISPDAAAGNDNETTTDAALPGKNKDMMKGNKPGKTNTQNKALPDSTGAGAPVHHATITVSRTGKKTTNKNERTKTTAPVIRPAEEKEMVNTTAGSTGSHKKRFKPAGKAKAAITVVEPVSNSTVQPEENDSEALGTGNGKVKRFRGRTRATITVPGTAADNEVLVAKTVTGADDIQKTEQDNKTKDSLAVDAKLLVTKPAVTDTGISPIKAHKAKRIKKLYMDIGTMPFVAIQNNASLPAITRTTVNSTSRSEFMANEIHTVVNPSFTYSIALRKRVAAKWYAGIGLQYTQVKETVRLTGTEKNTRFNVIKRLDNSGLFLVDDTVASVTNGTRVIHATNSYRFISIPVFAQYNLWQKKNWLLSWNGGLVFNVSNLYKNSIEGTLQPQYSAAGLANKKERKIATDVFMSLRLSTLIGKHYRLFAEPAMQFNLQQYRMSNMVNYKHIHKAGLNVGIAWEITY